jgi:hypothetical protein
MADTSDIAVEVAGLVNRFGRQVFSACDARKPARCWSKAST